MIAFPWEIGYVGIGHDVKDVIGFVADAKIDATLVLNPATTAETVGQQRIITIGIKTLEEHGGE